VLIAARCSETIYRQRRVLAQWLSQAGWEVHFCGDAGNPRYVTELTAEGFTFHPLVLDQKSKNPAAALRLLLAYRRISRTVRPDIVHAFNAKPIIMGLFGSWLGARSIRVATVAGLGHVFMARSKLVRAIGQSAFRGALTLADAVIFYNNDDRKTFVDRHLSTVRKAHLIQGSGIDLAHFAPVPLPNGERLEILFVGRLLREKGVVETISAGRELRRRGVAARVTLVGDIDAHNPSSLCAAEIKAAVAEGVVEWKGPLHDIRPAVAASDVVLLPSHREGIPLALVEGGAMGRALVATDVPGCREVVRHERNGLLVPLGDVHALSDALAQLARDRAQVERLGAEASEDMRERFGGDRVSSRVAALYEQLLAGARIRLSSGAAGGQGARR
jgi:glycosyltransferase involved in cell wall biosynthesis